MPKPLNMSVKLLSLMLLVGGVSACSSNGQVDATLQLAQPETAYVFDESRVPFGQRIALDAGGFTIREHALSPHFGR